MGVLLLIFGIVRLIPGDPCVAMLGENATFEKCDAFKERYGLDDNIMVQFYRYLQQLPKGDLGDSIRFQRPVTDIIVERLPMTVELAFFGMLFSTTVGISLGIVAALNRNTIIDTITMVIANIGISMPVFWLGLMLAYVFALLLKGTPFFIPPSGRLTAGISLVPLAVAWNLEDAHGFLKFIVTIMSNSAIINSLVTQNWTALKDALWHLILPSIAVGTISLCIIARITRSSLLDILGQDYIRTARAKGLVERLVVVKHAMRNALIPVVTIIGLSTAQLLAGAVLTETVFSLPGMGTAMVSAITARDYPVVQGITLTVALIFIFVNPITKDKREPYITRENKSRLFPSKPNICWG